MMKFLALVVIIAVVVCKSETAFVGKGELKKGSARIITMEGRELKKTEEQIVQEAMKLAVAQFENEKEIADYVLEYVRSEIEKEWFCFVAKSGFSPYGLAHTSKTVYELDSDDSDFIIKVIKV